MFGYSKLLFDRLETFRFYRRFKRFDKRSGFFSLGVPSLIVMMSIIVTGTFLVDKQLEVKYLRERSLTNREMSLKEEHEQMLKMLNKVIPTDKLDNSVPIPKVED